jgi:hypothetical protein
MLGSLQRQQMDFLRKKMFFEKWFTRTRQFTFLTIIFYSLLAAAMLV